MGATMSHLPTAVTFHVFTYGSLVVPEVMEAVTGRQFQYAESLLPEFERFVLKGQSYPGIIHTGHGSTVGRVYFDIDDESLERLDHFEDDYYVRQIVDVETLDHPELKAFTYVIPLDQRDLLSDDPWDESRFVAESLEAFLAWTRRSMKEYPDAV